MAQYLVRVNGPDIQLMRINLAQFLLELGLISEAAVPQMYVFVENKRKLTSGEVVTRF